MKKPAATPPKPNGSSDRAAALHTKNKTRQDAAVPETMSSRYLQTRDYQAASGFRHLHPVRAASPPGRDGLRCK